MIRIEQAMIPMRDGVRLATDLYLPAGEGPWPVILVRTPYGKQIFDAVTTPSASFFARAGYVVAVQDKRGKHGSEGDYRYCAHDGPDGWDTADWLVARPFCSGRIGTYGSSYLGDTQLSLGRLRHPAVKCLTPHAASMLGGLGGRFTMGDTRVGGAFYLATYIRWFYERGARKTDKTLAPLDLDAACRLLPLETIFDQIDGPPCDWRDVLTRGPDDPWWDAAAMLTDADRFDVPALHINSWFDVGLQDTLALFDHMRRTSLSALARDNQYLIVSPAAHCGSERLGAHDRIGDLDVEDAGLPWERIYLDWFDRWLRDEGDLEAWPRVRYFEVNRNRWRQSPAWPPPAAREAKLALSSGGGANSTLGDGVLGAVGEAASDRFVSDPRDPVPTVGGARPSAYLQIEPLDQAPTAQRRDILAYTSARVGGAGLEIAGAVTAILFVETDATDIDLVARLVDVHPDGRALDLRDGIVRCRYRHSALRPALMAPGVIHEVEVSMQSLSAWLPPGHRLRLEIAGSSFPRYDRNLQTGGDNVSESQGVSARVTLWHDAAHPSALRLEIVGEVPAGLAEIGARGLAR